jgi:hypothetical protein
MIINNKAARTRQLVFSILLSFVLLSCEESGTVGPGFINESKIVVDTLALSSFTIQSIDAYTGRLAVAPVGFFSDQLYGDLEARSYIKPSISNTSSAQFGDTVSISLALNFDQNNIYGDTLNDASFSVYRITEQWRGSAMQQSTLLATDMVDGSPAMNRVAQFSTADMDTSGIISVELSNDWEIEYLQYFNSDESNRDSTYFYENFGLAIIPDEGGKSISYIRFGSSNLRIITPGNDTTSVQVQDWAYTVEREGGNVPGSHFTFNTLNDPYLFIDLEQVAESIDNQNFARAEIVFVPDTTLMQESLGASEVRTNPGVLLFQTLENTDLAFELGFASNPTVASTIDANYRVNVTSPINDYLFGNSEAANTAIYMAQNSGYLGFRSVYGIGAESSVEPKILIFNIEK